MQSADFLSAVFFYLKVGENLNQNWIVENLNNAFSTWNGKLGELWGLVTTGPQTFKGGAVWSVMQTLHNGMVGMHEITYEVEEVDTTPEPTEDDPDPEQQTDYILHITVSSKTVDELAELYNFTQDQKDILHQLLSEEMRPSLLALCGGIAVADGELCWPLPGHTYISCHFGEVDAFGNAGHRGTDIPAPEGTPILAAHSGTVLVSGWNDSYGNQVLLDNGAGLSTRYAHMTQTAVTAGEAVTAGQIIGYVGSTGDSTGNHLHFEVMQNGVRMNPLELVFAQ